jgi:folate-binding protein YgfZ
MFSVLERDIITLQGPDILIFLQGLITQDTHLLQSQPSLYSCILSPQGKFLYDFFLYRTDQHDLYLIDCSSHYSSQLLQTLNRYRLRKPITWEIVTKHYGLVHSLMVCETKIGGPDPRWSTFGFRYIIQKNDPLWEQIEPSLLPNYRQHQQRYFMPEGGNELISTECFPLDYQLNQLHAIADNKGCYVGQEVTTRMRHRAVTRKQFMGWSWKNPMEHEEHPPINAPLIGRAIGNKDGSRSCGHVLCHYNQSSGSALIRYDFWQEIIQSQEDIYINGREITLHIPPWSIRN